MTGFRGAGARLDGYLHERLSRECHPFGRLVRAAKRGF